MNKFDLDDDYTKFKKLVKKEQHQTDTKISQFMHDINKKNYIRVSKSHSHDIKIKNT